MFIPKSIASSLGCKRRMTLKPPPLELTSISGKVVKLSLPQGKYRIHSLMVRIADAEDRWDRYLDLILRTPPSLVPFFFNMVTNGAQVFDTLEVGKNGFHFFHHGEEVSFDRRPTVTLVHSSYDNKDDLLRFIREGFKLEDLPDFKEDDRELVLELLKFQPEMFALLPDSFKADRSFFKRVVENDGSMLARGTDTWKSDKELVLSAISQDGFSLQYASDTLKSDLDVLAAALKKSYYTINLIPQEVVESQPFINMLNQIEQEDLKHLF